MVLSFGKDLVAAGRKVIFGFGRDASRSAAIALVWLVVICLDWRGRLKVQNLYYKNSYAEAPSWKVLKVLRGLLLKKSPKQGLGQSPKVFPTYIRWRSEQRQAAAIPIPLDGIGRETSGMGRIKPATQNPHCVKPISKTPWLKFLKFLKTSFKKFLSRGWDRVPRSSSLISGGGASGGKPPRFQSRWTGLDARRPEWVE